ncbi:MAG: hypothetical protein KC432_16935 [Thermomicrobiales bacterium]|nr:hypothetical protein [Thermomicrobiales bacterium]
MPLVQRYLRAVALPVGSLNDGLPRSLIGGETAQASSLATSPWPLTDADRNLTVAFNLNRYLFLNDLNASSVLDPAWPGAATLRRLDSLTTGDLIRRAGGSEVSVALLDAHGGAVTSRSPALGAIADLAYHVGDQNLFRVRGGNVLRPHSVLQKT